MFVTFLTDWSIHHINFNKLMSLLIFLHITNFFPFACNVFMILMLLTWTWDQHISWHNMYYSIISECWKAGRCFCVNKWEVLIAHAQYEMFWSGHIIIFINRGSFGSIYIILIILRRFSIWSHIRQCIKAVIQVFIQLI